MLLHSHRTLHKINLKKKRKKNAKNHWILIYMDVGHNGLTNFFQLFHVFFLISPLHFLLLIGFGRNGHTVHLYYGLKKTGRVNNEWICSLAYNTIRTNCVFCLVHLWHQCAKLVLYDFYSKRYFCSNDFLLVVVAHSPGSTVSLILKQFFNIFHSHNFEDLRLNVKDWRLKIFKDKNSSSKRRDENEQTKILYFILFVRFDWNLWNSSRAVVPCFLVN